MQPRARTQPRVRSALYPPHPHPATPTCAQMGVHDPEVRQLEQLVRQQVRLAAAPEGEGKLEGGGGGGAGELEGGGGGGAGELDGGGRAAWGEKQAAGAEGRAISISASAK